MAVAQDDCGSCDTADVKSADSKCCPDADACVDTLADTPAGKATAAATRRAAVRSIGADSRAFASSWKR